MELGISLDVDYYLYVKYQQRLLILEILQLYDAYVIKKLYVNNL